MLTEYSCQYPAMSEHYYHSSALARLADIGTNAPDLAKKFFDWYGAVFADGALTAREKSLIALAVAHAVQCPYCIDAYSKDAAEKGPDARRTPNSPRKKVRTPIRCPSACTLPPPSAAARRSCTAFKCGITSAQ